MFALRCTPRWISWSKIVFLSNLDRDRFAVDCKQYFPDFSAQSSFCQDSVERLINQDDWQHISDMTSWTDRILFHVVGVGGLWRLHFLNKSSDVGFQIQVDFCVFPEVEYIITLHCYHGILMNFVWKGRSDEICPGNVGLQCFNWALDWNYQTVLKCPERILADHYWLNQSSAVPAVVVPWRLQSEACNADRQCSTTHLHFEDVVRDAIRAFVASRVGKVNIEVGTPLKVLCLHEPSTAFSSVWNQLYLCLACCCPIVG